MFGKILVPLDGSDLAELTLPYAEEMVGRLGSKLTLLHISQSAEDPHGHVYQSYLEKVAANTRDGVKRYLRKDKERVINIDTKMLAGHPAEQIIDYADSQKIALVIIATHGRSGIRRWALGSVADKVIRGAKQSVLLIRAGSSRSRVPDRGMLNKVLVTLDGSELSEAVIPYVEELARRLEAELTLLMVLNYHYYFATEYTIYLSQNLESDKASARGYLEKTATQLRQKGISARYDIRVGKESEEINAFANEINADAIAMATHGRSGVSRFAFGSVVDKVLHEGTLPLLLVRAPDTRCHDNSQVNGAR